MKKFALILISSVLFFTACNKNKLDCCVFPETVTVTLKFTHNWDGTPITATDFNDFKFTTENGELVSIEKLRYLVSNITLDSQIKNYNLINIGENTDLEINFTDINQGTNNLKFTFGFADADNTDGIYQDLNSVSFNVPEMMGGGYHFMQFDGKYKDTNNEDASFNYHAIRAVDMSDTNNLIFEDTSFEVDLGTVEITNNAIVEVKVNIAEWFKNPNTWNLNELNTVLMPNFEAQKMMSANGKTVFSLGDIN
ncbi:MbnP family protein [uncultured Polaribacter sp.]|uniref:MbnP family protein n=1 Tax=uncultured Polaribacter sp. TaxID=174711 RepID=UPI00260B5C00|nr:MbnP family protein [uncultured Polaribacter sp.]